MNSFARNFVFAVAATLACAGQASLAQGTSPTPPAPRLVQAQQTQVQAEAFYSVLVAESLLRERKHEEAYALLMDAARKSGDARIYKRAAEAALAGGRRAAALDAAKLWADGTTDPEAARQLASLFVAMRRSMEAVPYLERDIAKRPALERPQALFTAQRILGGAENKREALDATRALVVGMGSSPDAALIVARAAFAAGDDVLGFSELNRAVTLKSPGAATYPPAAMVALELLDPTKSATDGRSVAANSLLMRYTAEVPEVDGIVADYFRKLSLWKAIDGANAAQALATILTERLPSSMDAWLVRAGLRDINTQNAAARSDYSKALALAQAVLSGTGAADLKQRAGNVADAALLGLAASAEHRRDYPTAEGHIAQIKRTEMKTSAQLRLAYAAITKKDFDVATRLVGSLPDTSLDERRIKVQTGAQLLRERGKLADAAALYAAFLATSADDIDVLYEAALLAERQGKLAEMEAGLKRVMQLKPDHAHAFNALGYSLAERGVRLPEARQLIERALQITPDDPLIIDSLGWVLYRMGDASGALKELKRAYAMKADAEIAAHLGEVLWEQNQRDEASRLLRNAIKADKDSEPLQKIIKKLNLQ